MSLGVNEYQIRASIWGGRAYVLYVFISTLCQTFVFSANLRVRFY